MAFILLRRRRPSALLASAAAGFAALIWIFVQMMLIPFSFLQAVYFIAGAVELGLVMLLLGLLPITPAPTARRRPAEAQRGRAEPPISTRSTP